MGQLATAAEVWEVERWFNAECSDCNWHIVKAGERADGFGASLAEPSRARRRAQKAAARHERETGHTVRVCRILFFSQELDEEVSP